MRANKLLVALLGLSLATAIGHAADFRAVGDAPRACENFQFWRTLNAVYIPDMDVICWGWR